MNHRTGTTLMEVLMAIFIMTLGLASILVLFPLGAVNMSQAIKEDRSALACRNAVNIARAWNFREDYRVHPNYYSAVGLLPLYPGYLHSSIPVYLDAMGNSYITTKAVGDLPGTSVGFPRFPPFTGATPQKTQRWFTLRDGVTFDVNGMPLLLGGQVQRDPRFSWAYLCRQARATGGYSTLFTTAAVGATSISVDDAFNVYPGQPITFARGYSTEETGYVSQAYAPYSLGTTKPFAIALQAPLRRQASNSTVLGISGGVPPTAGTEVSVVVYDRRRLAYNNNKPMGETTYQATFTAGSDVATITWPSGTAQPAVQRGTWVLDATLRIDSTPFYDLHCYFYRVVSTTQVNSNTMELTLSTKAKASAPVGACVVMENVVEVIEMGPY